MKINIDIDCTPQEARAFLGLPDVTPINDAMMAQMQARIENGFDPEEMDALMRTWMQSATTGVGEWQKSFMSLMQQAASGGPKG